MFCINSACWEFFTWITGVNRNFRIAHVLFYSSKFQDELCNY